MPRSAKKNIKQAAAQPTPQLAPQSSRAKSKPRASNQAPITQSPKRAKPRKRTIAQYDHPAAERVNNPPVGLVTPETDSDTRKKTYAYDPHLDPQLQWAGKAERTSFEVPLVSLHVHERIDARTIVEAVRKRDNGDGNLQYQQLSFFHAARENPPLREAIQFYKHKHNWSNRLIAGDSLLVMNSLLEKEGMAGKVQMIYIDPPYGIKYGSNFQPFVNKRDVKDGKDEDLTQEPEMVKAFRDTWELGIHSYLTYLRDRLLLARELLHESGSVFVQISDENVHHVRELMDEIFGIDNFTSQISFTKTITQTSTYLPSVADTVIWYAKDKKRLKYRPLFTMKRAGEIGASRYQSVELPDGIRRRLTDEELQNQDLLPQGSRLFTTGDLTSQEFRPGTTLPFKFQGKEYLPNSNRHWNLSMESMERLAKMGRIVVEGLSLRAVRYLDDQPAFPISNIWTDTMGIQSRSDPRVYVVQTATSVVTRCTLMTTDPGDLVLDPTCGSGTTAYVAEQWGRRWITCDTSRVAVTLAKQRLMTALFDYYELARPEDGVDSGFRYKTVPHITLKSIANNEPPAQETLYDQPFADNSKARVTGPFTVEAVPAPVVKPLTALTPDPSPSGRGENEADVTIARSGETLRQAEWRAELFRTGIRGKGGQKIEFARVEPLAGTRWLHADAETRGEIASSPRKDGEPTRNDRPLRAVISFGPDFAPLEQRQVELAIQEANLLVPKPKIVVFAAFEFDPEASKDIDETEWPGMTFLKAQMNTDLLTDDLKKKRSSNESFWLIGQPDVRLEKIKTGADKGLYRVEVNGFDYYNVKTGSIESGGTDKIAMWLLDTDYDGRSLYPRQVFFPMSGEKDGWARLAKNLKAELDEDLIEQYRGTASLPFDVGKHERVAVKIVDDRGIESLKIIEVDG